MEDMHVPDLNIMVKYLEFAQTAEWEKTRELLLAVRWPYLRNKRLKSNELLPLPCDAKWHEKSELTTEVKQSDLDWFRKYKEQLKKDSQ